jgi:hypothetical protein
MSQNSGGFDSCRNRSSTGENPVEIDDTDPETLYPSSSRTSFESITWPDSLAGAGSGKDPALSADISMSRNIIIAIAAIGAFTSSAAARERRPEIVTGSQPAFTALQVEPADEPPHVAKAGASANEPQILADLVSAPSVIPSGPRDLPRDYELEMASIAQRLSTDMEAISKSVGTGQITREQGEYVNGERCQVAMMQFQLFGALHIILEEDIARAPAVRTKPNPSAGGEMVLVALPFSSLELNPSLVEYLGLNPAQVRSIQRLMDQERPTTEPLMLELRAVSRELGIVIRQSQNKDDGAASQRLRSSQARLIKQLIKANSRLQRRIDDVLDPQQRKKLDAFRRTVEVTVGEGN